jgi:tRNA (pseudouridine54-N1)-methyltransferase
MLDERSTGALIQHALRALQEGRSESTPGVCVSKGGLSELLEGLIGRDVAIYVLDERGRDIRDLEIEEPAAFILSDHQNFTPHEEELLARLERISLGPVVLHADHCIPLVHNELDRRGLRSG